MSRMRSLGPAELLFRNSEPESREMDVLGSKASKFNFSMTSSSLTSQVPAFSQGSCNILTNDKTYCVFSAP